VDLTIGFMTGNKSSFTKLEAGDWVRVVFLSPQTLAVLVQQHLLIMIVLSFLKVKKLYSNSGLESPADEAVQAALGNHTVLNQQQLKEFLLLLVNQI